MDIFTTALTKVRTNPIKQKKLKVKSLVKESATSELTDDINHLEQHELYFIDEKTHHENKKRTVDMKDTEHGQADEFEQGVVPSDDVIIHKDEIIHPKSSPTDEQDDDNIKHLDLFV